MVFRKLHSRALQSSQETGPYWRRNVSLDASNTGENEPRDAEDAADDEGVLAAIVAGCRQGDRAAQRGLYDVCQDRVYRVAVRMVGRQEADDITQQVFLQAFRSIGQFQGQSRIETWLYRLTVNECLQFVRRNRRWRFASLEWEPTDGSNRREEREQRELLDEALARLDPELRSIFVLKEVEQLSYREIAEAVQIPEGTVGSRLNRARRELQQHLSSIGFQSP